LRRYSSDDSARVHDDDDEEEEDDNEHDVESTPFRDGFLFGLQPAPSGALVPGRGLHSSTSLLNLSRFCH
jgi:hypothetical protein